QYNFNGKDAPVNLTIQNKLNVPVYIDWRKSALIINDKAISYVPTMAPITGTINASSYNWNRSFYTSNGSINAAVALSYQLDIIPPQTYITKSPLGVTNQLIENVP